MDAATNSILQAMESLALETRVEMAQSIREMREHPGWGVFTKLMDDLVDQQRGLFEMPKVKDHTEYVALHQSLAGMRRIQAIPDAVIESGDRANELLRQTVAAMEAER